MHPHPRAGIERRCSIGANCAQTLTDKHRSKGTPVFARLRAPRAPAVLLTSFAVNGATAFLVILAMTLGLILRRLLCEHFLPAPE